MERVSTVKCPCFCVEGLVGKNSIKEKICLEGELYRMRTHGLAFYVWKRKTLLITCFLISRSSQRYGILVIKGWMSARLFQIIVGNTFFSAAVSGGLNQQRVWELAQMRSWNWMKARSLKFSFSVYEWTFNPRYCLGCLWFTLPWIGLSIPLSYVRWRLDRELFLMMCWYFPLFLFDCGILCSGPSSMSNSD